MISSNFNFGLTGQRGDDFDYLFCGKRCKKRKKVRLEKKKLKNEEKKASIERTRAETKIMTQTLASKPAPKLTAPAIKLPAAGGKLAQAGFGGNTIMLVLGVLVIGGFFLMQRSQPAEIQLRPRPAMPQKPNIQ